MYSTDGAYAQSVLSDPNTCTILIHRLCVDGWVCVLRSTRAHLDLWERVLEPTDT